MVNIRKLCEFYLQKHDVLTDIFYFSALPTWDADKTKRHQLYLDALRSENVEVVLGKFKKVTRRCLVGCNGNKYNTFQTFEEKETDVNIAIHLLEYGLTNKFDKAVIVSGDSDLIPPVRRIRELFPKKIVACVIPKNGYDLGNHCNQHARLKESTLKACLFDSEIRHGGKLIVCPESDWLPASELC